MKVTVVQARDFGVLTELAFLLMSEERAVKMFKKEYPDYKDIRCYEFDSEARGDLYRAYSNAGCIRFYRTY